MVHLHGVPSAVKDAHRSDRRLPVTEHERLTVGAVGLFRLCRLMLPDGAPRCKGQREQTDLRRQPCHGTMGLPK